jgi:peptidoglycan hydrolase CwlO-like protein
MKKIISAVFNEWRIILIIVSIIYSTSTIKQEFFVNISDEIDILDNVFSLSSDTKHELQNINNNLNDINNEINDVKSKLDSINRGVTDYDISDLDTKISDINDKLNSFEIELDSIYTALLNVTGTLDDIVRAINSR